METLTDIWRTKGLKGFYYVLYSNNEIEIKDLTNIIPRETMIKEVLCKVPDYDEYKARLNNE